MDNETTQKSVLLIDEYTSPEGLKLVESKDTPTGPNSGVVIATLFGTLSDFGNETRNGRWYTAEVWNTVMNKELFKECLATKTLYGEPDHPLDIENRLETHIPYVSHIVRDPKINTSKQIVEGYIDILDTPNGRIVKTLIDYGCTLGVSSRGSGDLTYRNGRTEVDPDQYNFITWDIVSRPSNKKARIHEIDTINSHGKTAFESMKDQIHTMISNNDKNSLMLTESLISTSDISDKSELIKIINESLESETNTDNDDNDDKVSKSDLDDAYLRLIDLKKINSELDGENKDLHSKLDDSDNTIKELSTTNENLKSMVSSYMQKLAESVSYTNDHDDTNKSHEDNDASDGKVNFDDYTIRKDLSDVSNQLTESKIDIIKKISELIDKLDSTDKSDDNSDELTDEINDLHHQLDDMKKSKSRITSELNSSKSDCDDLRNRYSESISEYLKLRCSQLSINENLVRRSLTDALNEYSISDINDVISDVYTKSSNGDRVINESVSHPKKLGSLELSGSLVKKSYKSSTNDDDDDDFNMLTETIKSVRNK